MSTKSTSAAAADTYDARMAAIERIRESMRPALVAMSAARKRDDIRESRTIDALGVRLDWTAYQGGAVAEVCTVTERGTTTVEGGPAVLASVAHAARVYTEEVRAKWQAVADGQIAALEAESAAYAAIPPADPSDEDGHPIAHADMSQADARAECERVIDEERARAGRGGLDSCHTR